MSDADASPDRSPFRRFPWPQLAFCVACLAMTAWSWMRYSYAWDIAATEIASTWPPASIACESGSQSSIDKRGSGLHNDELIRKQKTLRGRYVAFSAKIVEMPLSVLGASETDLPFRPAFVTPDGNKVTFWIMLPLDEPITRWKEVRTVRGRVLCDHTYESQGGTPTFKGAVVDTTACRFHAASVAGIVVGAMGCLIFCLYARRWLRARRAAA